MSKTLAEVTQEKNLKTKIQVSLDKDVVEQAERKLRCYGLSRTTALNVFYHAIASSNTFPITPQLSEREIALQELDSAFAKTNIPTKRFKNKEEARKFVLDDANW